MRNGNFLSLFTVENKKLWKRMATKIMIIIDVALIVFVCSMVKFYNTTQKNSNNSSSKSSVTVGWKQELKAEDVVLKQSIKTQEKLKTQIEKTGVDNSKKTLAENEYRIAHNLKPDNDNNTYWQNVEEMDISFLIALFVIIACASLIAGEFSDGTMKTMITRPFSRWQILTAKLAAVLLYAAVLMAVTLAAVMVCIAAFFGTGGAATPLLFWVGGKVLCVNGFVGTLIIYGLDFLKVIVYMIFAFALASIFRSRAVATGFSIFLMLAGSYTKLLAMYFDWGKWIFFADTDFSTFVKNGAPFYGITLSLALIICAVYAAAFLFAGYFTFAKRDIS
jgi:ABC-2 type transport system permease protein